MHHLIPAPLRTAGDDGRELLLDASTTITAGPGTEGTERWLRSTLGAAYGLPFAPRPRGPRRPRTPSSCASTPPWSPRATGSPCDPPGAC